LINGNLLNAENVSWLNNYHELVYSSLEKHLDKNEREWLKTACSPL
jgi:Xaa-Pro aminopeptidase